jgi:hypothetical protein
MYGVGIHASIEAQTDFIENVKPLFGNWYSRRHSKVVYYGQLQVQW